MARTGGEGAAESLCAQLLYVSTTFPVPGRGVLSSLHNRASRGRVDTIRSEPKKKTTRSRDTDACLEIRLLGSITWLTLLTRARFASLVTVFLCNGCRASRQRTANHRICIAINMYEIPRLLCIEINRASYISRFRFQLLDTT